MVDLPRPSFVDRDPVAITEEAIRDYEAMSGRKLRPAQVERLVIDLVAYRESLTRIAIQEAAEQNLLAYARYPMLDHLGELLGVRRLPAQAAVTTLRFTADPALGFDQPIPAGTRARTRDGRFQFATDVDATLRTGESHVDVTASCRSTGPAGNGYVAGEIDRLLRPIAGVAVANLSASHGGLEVEGDERLRRRIQEAPERFSVAGPSGAYRWFALSADQQVRDVAVTSPAPGQVVVHVLALDGTPSAELVDAVAAHLDDDKRRPLTDSVTVQAATKVDYDITATITLSPRADTAAATAALEAAAAAWAADRRKRLGWDVVPSQLTAALSGPEVHRVELASPNFIALAADEWADAQTIALTVNAYDG